MEYDYPDAGANAQPEIQLAIERFRQLSEDERSKQPLLYWLLGTGTPPYKVSAEDSEYSDISTDKGKTCSNCEWYYIKVANNKGICSKIEPYVEPLGWCNRWDPIRDAGTRERDRMSSEIVDDLVIDYKLKMGYSPAEILYDYFDSHKVSSRDFVEAREMVAFAKTKFFIDIAKAMKSSLTSVIKLFKDPRIVKFFGKIKWSFEKLFGLLKNGYKAYKELQKAIGEFISETKIGKWTTENLKKLDEWLQKHPKMKKMAGVAIGALLIYFWFNQSFIGDPAFDFDMSYILDAIGGKFALADLFGGPSGMTLLLAIAVGFGTGASFPWPSPSSVKFVLAIIGTLTYKIGKKLKKTRENPEEEADRLGLI